MQRPSSLIPYPGRVAGLCGVGGSGLSDWHAYSRVGMGPFQP
jgi:hypothetical protein